MRRSLIDSGPLLGALGSLPAAWRLDISHPDGGSEALEELYVGKFVYDTRKGVGETCGTIGWAIGTEGGKLGHMSALAEAVSCTKRRCMHSCE